MAYALWLVSLGAFFTTLVALVAGKVLAGKGKIFPVLPFDKLIFAGKAWFFVTSVSVVTYVATETVGLDESTQTTLAGFLVPVIAGALFVKNRLAAD